MAKFEYPKEPKINEHYYKLHDGLWVCKYPPYIADLYDQTDIIKLDVVNVIRCRDCENLMKSDDNFGEDEPYYYCDTFNHMINLDDFCSRAERRSQ